jgi:hypothetical protein
MALRSWGGLCATLLVFALSLAAGALPAVAAGGGCTAPASWFTGIPMVPDTAPASPCQFQQFAWQTFLALLETSPAQPVPRYLQWGFPKPAINGLFCQQACPNGTPKAPFNQCGGPPTQEVVNATTQPGFPPKDAAGNPLSGEVIDQAGNPVYFTAHVSPAWIQFVTNHQLANPAVLSAAEPQQSFPSGSFEIKTSWRLAAGMSEQEKAQYFVTTGCVIPETKSCCSVPVGAGGSCPAGDQIACATEQELALVGFHVTGGADNHPELIWATFEHQNTAPDCDETPQPGPWSLYDGVTDCRSDEAHCNQANPASGPAKPTNVCRKYSHGGAAPEIARQIDQLNGTVLRQLPVKSPLRFYKLVGTLWATDPAPAPAPFNVRTPTVNLTTPGGSPLLSNTTLETFKQDVSCFGCHNSQFPGEFAGLVGNPQVNPQMVTVVDKTLYMSHVILFPYFFTAQNACTCPAPPPGS